MEPTLINETVPTSENQIELQESVDLCFMLDCTGSMQSYINMARNRVQEVIVKVQEEYPKAQVRIGIVAYRDVQDSNRFEIFPFEASSENAKQFLAKLRASGGGDTPEDVNGAFQKTLFKMEWQNPIKLIVHIADAPCHGRDFHSENDNHPEGYKEDMDWNKIFKELVEKKIDYLFIKILPITDRMFEKFQAFAEKHGSLEAELTFQQEQIPVSNSSNSYGYKCEDFEGECEDFEGECDDIFGEDCEDDCDEECEEERPKEKAPMRKCEEVKERSKPTMKKEKASENSKTEECFVDKVSHSIKAAISKKK